MKALHTARAIASAERGAALVMALLVLIVLTAFGLTLVGLGMTDFAISSSWRDYSKDFYAAEAGLESGVVALRNLLATTPAPTPSQLTGIATAPTLTDTRLTFGAYTITSAAPTYQQTFATGPYKDLFGLASLYQIRAQVNGIGGTRADLGQTLQYTRVPLFQFGVFYGQGVDLEMAPGASMTFNGRIHANSNIYLGAVAGGSPPTPGLGIDSYMTTAGGIYRTIKRDNAPNCNPCAPPNTPYPPSSYNKDYNDPYIKDAAGAYHALNFDSKYQSFPGTTWASQSAWANQANTTFQGRVKDNAMGVGQITPPIPDLFFNPSNPDVVAHKLIEMPQTGDSAALVAAKMYSQANVRVIDGVATGLTCGTVPSGAITTRTFYDAREGKTMTATDLDVNSLRTNNCLPNGAVVYVAGTDTSTNPAVRLVNGSQLPSEGMTVVSQNPVYVKGNYNSVNKVPAAILGDAITVLSNQWSDSNSSQPLDSRDATGPMTVNAAFGLGPSVESTYNQGNGQLENVIRFLEDWHSNAFNYSGSIVALWHSQQATAPWISPGTYYRPPIRVWSYDTMFNTTPPPGTPMGIIMTKGRWSQS